MDDKLLYIQLCTTDNLPHELSVDKFEQSKDSQSIQNLIKNQRSCFLQFNKIVEKLINLSFAYSSVLNL